MFVYKIFLANSFDEIFTKLLIYYVDIPRIVAYATVPYSKTCITVIHKRNLRIGRKFGNKYRTTQWAILKWNFNVGKVLKNVRIFWRSSKKRQNFDVRGRYVESMSIFQWFFIRVEKALKNQLWNNESTSKFSLSRAWVCHKISMLGSRNGPLIKMLMPSSKLQCQWLVKAGQAWNWTMVHFLDLLEVEQIRSSDPNHVCCLP